MRDYAFNLKPSRYYTGILLCMWFVSVLIIFNLPFGFIFKISLLLVLCIYSGWLFFRFAWLRSNRAITQIRRLAEGNWLLQSRRHTYTAELRGDSTVTQILSILRFRVPGQFLPINCVIFCDTLTPDDYRTLLMLLRMGTS